jgi:hypothetical protein
MTDAELVHAWRVSYALLTQRLGSDDLLMLADHRFHLLREMERRHPTGINRWLIEGAGAASDPTRYLGSRGAEPDSGP